MVETLLGISCDELHLIEWVLSTICILHLASRL